MSQKLMEFSPEHKDSIRDALEMRSKECDALIRNCKAAKTYEGKMLAMQFKRIKDSAEATLKFIDQLEYNGKW